MADGQVDRLVVLIVYRWQYKSLIEALTANKYSATAIHATGGLMHEGMVTLVLGTPHRRLPALFCLVRDTCPASTRYIPYDVDMTLPWEPECEVVVIRAGGVSAFVLPVEQFVQL
jgi:uncharacterized protein YaaQ